MDKCSASKLDTVLLPVPGVPVISKIIFNSPFFNDYP